MIFIMNIPNFEDVPVIVKKGDDYFWSDEWRFIMQQLFQTLQQYAGNEGLVPPSQKTTDITVIQPHAQNGTIIYDQTTNQLKGLIAGVFKVFTLV